MNSARYIIPVLRLLSLPTDKSLIITLSPIALQFWQYRVA